MSSFLCWVWRQGKEGVRALPVILAVQWESSGAHPKTLRGHIIGSVIRKRREREIRLSYVGAAAVLCRGAGVEEEMNARIESSGVKRGRANGREGERGLHERGQKRDGERVGKEKGKGWVNGLCYARNR